MLLEQFTHQCFEAYTSHHERKKPHVRFSHFKTLIESKHHKQTPLIKSNPNITYIMYLRVCAHSVRQHPTPFSSVI